MTRDWQSKTLGRICDEVGGLIQTGPFGSQLHQSDYSAEGVPVVMPKDIVGGRIVTDSIARVSERHATRLEHHRLRGDIGRRAFVMPSQAGWLCGTGCLRLRPDEGEQVVLVQLPGRG